MKELPCNTCIVFPICKMKVTRHKLLSIVNNFSLTVYATNCDILIDLYTSVEKDEIEDFAKLVKNLFLESK
jgi:hypothetical protein